jgi:MFS superfamily sulfate permease-like transporter
MNQPFKFHSQDLSAGIVVFLVALPLCLGIALASGAPLMSGIIAGIVGGVVVSLLSGSQLSVTGPAAGMTVIVATTISALGSFEACLAAVIIAGLFQVSFGVLKTGGIADYVPFSVIRGMLVGIGLIIIYKQASYALGIDSNFVGDIPYSESGAFTYTFHNIFAPIKKISPTTLLISSIGVLVLVLWDLAKKKTNLKFFQFIPGPLVVVIFGVSLNQFLLTFTPTQALTAESGMLVRIPIFTSSTELYSALPKPDLSFLMSLDVIYYGFIIAVIASIETLLSIEATDKLDPLNRITSTNKELIAQGIGNIFCGFLGGLPITSVILRSSANIQAGAKSKLSSFYHGLFLLITIITIPTLLNKIPLACLAAILIVIGFKLASFKTIKSSLTAEKQQSIPFLVTVLGTVLFDLLTGVVSGTLVGVFFILKANSHQVMTVVNESNMHLIRFNKDVSFVHRSMLKDILENIPDNCKVFIDGSHALFIDHDVIEVISEFIDGSIRRDIEVSTKNIFRNQSSKEGK